MPQVIDSRTVFQSTPSARRATTVTAALGNLVVISIHALREEGDLIPCDGTGTLTLFQSTPSARRATITQSQGCQAGKISIHALREEGDAASAMTPLHTGHFNPRSPWGERREQEIIIRAALEFQSTLSVGRATKGAQHTVIGLVLFQSTPSARRATHRLLQGSQGGHDFNPRPPRGGRPVTEHRAVA